MTDFTDTDDLPVDNDAENDGIKSLREAAKAGKKAQQEADALRAELDAIRKTQALRDAGLDPESKQAKAVLRLHDGDITADALKATAIEHGFMAEPQPAVPAEELSAISQFAAANPGNTGHITASDDFTSVAEKAVNRYWEGDGLNDVLDAVKKLGIPVEYTQGQTYFPNGMSAGTTPIR